ncbi:MAG: hypothetical protein ACTSPW_10180 [Promethearchaeota archaeon]
MLLESIFMIRGGSFGQDFGEKLIFSIIGILICIYDYKTKNRRKDYFWVFITGTVIWASAEFILQITGMRIFQEKYLFGINITNMLWLTLLLQGMSEGAFVAVFGLLFGDRVINDDMRKKWLIYFLIVLGLFSMLYIGSGINFNNVDIGNPNIPSRRDMFTLSSIAFLCTLSGIAIFWLIITKSDYTRKRGLYMYLFMVLFIAWWTFLEWITGQRWIEMGTINPDDTYSNLHRAPPLIEFGALAFDVLVEVSLIYVPFLAFPNWLGLIKQNEA